MNKRKSIYSLFVFVLLMLQNCQPLSVLEIDNENERLFGVFKYDSFHLMLTESRLERKQTIFRLFDNNMEMIDDGFIVIDVGLGDILDLYRNDSQVSLFAIGEQIVVLYLDEHRFAIIPVFGGLVYVEEGYIHSEVAMGGGTKIDIETLEIVEEYTFEAYRVPEVIAKTDPNMENVSIGPYPHEKSLRHFVPELNEAYITKYGLRTYDEQRP